MSKTIQNGGSSAVNRPQFPEPLNYEQVTRLREEFGENVIILGKPLTWYNVLITALFHPFNVLLALLAIVSGATEDFDAMGIMLFMVFISTSLRFYQEYKSAVSAQSLKKMVSNKVCVIRYESIDFGHRITNTSNPRLIEEEIPFEDLVPGDWIKLSAGDLIPADIQLIESKDLFVSQSSLTGEAIPVEKMVSEDNINHFRPESANNEVVLNIQNLNGLKPNPNAVNYKPKVEYKIQILRRIRNILGLPIHHLESDMSIMKADLDCPYLCYMGTSIVSGTATAITSTTGSRTYFGSMATELSKLRPQNAFQMGVRRVSWLFFITMALMIPPVLLMQGFLHDNGWDEAFLFGLSVAVGLTPEMLPMIVNATLAKGAILMSKKKCIVKKLDSIINLGGMDILCTDKTGTLTYNQVALIRHVDYFGKTSTFPLQLAFLNSYFQTGLKNLLDVAVIDYVKKVAKITSGILTIEEDDRTVDSFNDIRLEQMGSISQTPIVSIANQFIKVDEIPFDFERRRMSVILKDNSGGGSLLISKGAVDEMLNICSHIYFGKNKTLESIETQSNGITKIGGESESTPNIEDINNLEIPNHFNVMKLTAQMIAHLKYINDLLNRDGIRVVAVAYKKFKTLPYSFQKSDEIDMIFGGFIGFLDPPKASAAPAIKNLLKHNINVKVLTGDSAVVCAKVCEEIKLPVNSIVTTSDLEGLTEDRFSEVIENGTIFAKLSPLQKAQVIRGLKRNGHIVGFLGDGINDSPALAEADIGISVDTGTDIAKESADIILLEKDLTVIINGVRYGRRTYGNTIKYIVMAVSSNFGNVFSVLVASAWLPFLPMLPIHLLTQNLLYDISQISLPWDRMDKEFLLVPHKWSMLSVFKFMVCLGPWSSIFDITTFAYMWFYYNIKTNEDNVSLFQTTWFTEGLLTQTFIVHMIRTPKIPFFQSRASPIVTFMTFFIVGVGLVLPYIPGISDWLDMVHLEPMVYPYIAAAILCYCIVAQLAKVLYIRIFGEWF